MTRAPNRRQSARQQAPRPRGCQSVALDQGVIGAHKNKRRQPSGGRASQLLCKFHSRNVVAFDRDPSTAAAVNRRKIAGDDLQVMEGYVIKPRLIRFRRGGADKLNAHYRFSFDRKIADFDALRILDGEDRSCGLTVVLP